MHKKITLIDIETYVECNDNAGRVFGGHLNAGAEESIVVIIRRNNSGSCN